MQRGSLIRTLVSDLSGGQLFGSGQAPPVTRSDQERLGATRSDQKIFLVHTDQLFDLLKWTKCLKWGCVIELRPICLHLLCFSLSLVQERPNVGNNLNDQTWLCRSWVLVKTQRFAPLFSIPSLFFVRILFSPYESCALFVFHNSHAFQFIPQAALPGPLVIQPYSKHHLYLLYLLPVRCTAGGG